MMRSKRFLALLTALVMLFLPLSITTEAATGTPVGDFLVDGADFVFNAERGLLEITGSSPVTVSNQNPDAPTWHHISVAPDVAANLTLAGVNINTSDMSGVPAISVPDSAVTVTVTLAEGTVNKLRSGDAATALQKLGTDGQLKITGSGTLNVTDGDEALSSIGAAPDSINAKVVMEGGSVFVNRLASQPVNASNTAVYRYVFKAAAYPNASVVSMNINGGQGFVPTGLRTDANGELSLFLPDGASVNTEVVLQVGEEQVAVQPGEYSWTAPLPVNVQGAPADVIPAKVQPNDYITIRVRPDEGTAVDSVTDYEQVGPDVWTGPYRDPVVINLAAAAIVPVTAIQLNSATEMDAGSSLVLDAYAMPENATNRAIQWSISDAGTTGATLDGATLYAPAGGTATVAATVLDGAGAGTPYTEYFTITVRSLFVPVTDIVLNSATEMDAGSSLILDAYAMPENATNRAIQWSMSDAGTTGAYLDGATLYAPAGGTATVAATVLDGAGAGTPYTEYFTITVRSLFVAVTDIVLNSATEMDAGSSLVLDAYAMPENATNRAIQWSISDAGTTGASLDGNTLYAPTGGTVTLAASVPDGSGAGTPYTEYFEITVRSLFVPVTDIVLNSAAEMDAGSSLALDAYAMPENATNRAIQWSISDAGTTGASLDGNTLYAPTGGTVTLAASVPDGSGAGTPYTEYFEITVRSLFVPVTDIVLNSAAEMDAGSSLVLDAYAMPENATNRAIQWSISDAGTTGASLDGNTLYAPTGGTVTLAASVPDGSAAGTPYTEYFEITVRSLYVAVTEIQLTSANAVDAGSSLELTAAVTPADATNPSITWSVIDAGDTGATIEGNVLSTVSPGTVLVAAMTDDLTREFTITVNAVYIPVTEIALTSANAVDAGSSLELTAAVTPADATNPSITWSVIDAGDTGATIEGNVLSTVSPGTVLVAAITDDLTREFTITVNAVYVPVTEIELTSANAVDAGSSLELTAAVTPADATNPSITWSVIDAGDTGAMIEGNVLSTVSPGTVLVAAITDDLTREFTITVNAVYVPVTEIELTSANAVDAGSSLELTAAVTPENATNPSITWSVIDAGDTGATIEGNVLSTVSPGTVLVAAMTDDLTREFTITVNAVYVPVTEIELTSANAVDAGSSLELTAAVTPENATNPSITWSVIDAGDTGATIEGNVLSTVSPGTVLVSAITDDLTREFTITVNEVIVPVTNIELSSATEVDAGESLALEASAVPADATNPTIVWSLVDAGDTGATLDGNVLTTVNPGTAIVSAAAGGFSKEFSITVNEVIVPVTNIELTSASEVDAGDSLALEASAVPADATNPTIVWSLVDAGDTGATLDGNVLTTVNPGTAIVSAAAGGFSKEFSITVNEVIVPVTNIELTSASEVDAGDSLALEASAVPADATNPTIVWSLVDAGDTGATLDGNVLTTVNPGTAIVSAAADTFSKEFTITVNAVYVPVTDIQLSSVSEVDAGESLALEASAVPADATNPTIVWSLVDAGDTGATLDGNVLTTVNPGTAIVSAAAGGFSKEFSITVNEVIVPVTNIELTSATEVDAGDSLALEASAVPADATNPTIVWSLVDAGDTGATLDGNVLTTVNPGTAIVSAAADTFSKEFSIAVNEVIVPVTNIELSSATEVDAGESLALEASAVPADATNPTIVWSLVDAGDTGATLDGNVLTTVNPGTAIVSAAAGGFSKEFSITVNEVIVPVTNIELTSATEVDAGDSLALEASAVPADATNPTIVWSLVDAGDTGATLDGNVLTTVNPGTAIVSAAAGGFSKEFSITVNEVIVPVTNIELSSATEVDAGESLALEASAVPADATNPTIVWALVDDGDTGATLDGNVLTTVDPGAVVVSAAAGGFSKEFTITVNEVIVPVTDIELTSATEVDAGESLTLEGAVIPAEATSPTITWALVDDGDTGATLDGNVLTTVDPGAVVVSAAADGFSKEFTITVNEVIVPVTDIELTSATEVDAGESLTLEGAVIPAEATSPTITWALVDDGDTGATLDGNVLTTVNPGTAIVSAAADAFSKEFTITVNAVYVPVTDIQLTSASEVDAGESLALEASAVPADATNPTIVWALVDAGDTGATLDGNVLTTVNPGTAIVSAAADTFSKEFSIAVNEVIVPVTNIELTSASEVDAGDSLALEASVVLSEATRATSPTITWALVDAGDTDATLDGNELTTVNPGTVIVSAAADTFSKEFTITVNEVIVPVTNIELTSASEVDAGESLALEASAVPADATSPTITWALVDDGDTGATLDGNVLTTVNPGTAIVSAAADAFSKEFTITVNEVIVPVTDIELTSATEVDAGEALTLEGAVIPAEATSPTITWALVNAGDTGATLDGNVLTTVDPGTVIVSAAAGGFSKEFSITVNAVFVSVADIQLTSAAEADVGDILILEGVVLPEDATNRTIVWSLVDAGTTGAVLSGSELSAASGGVAVVEARVAAGLENGSDFVKTFEIGINVPFVAVTDFELDQAVVDAGSTLTLSGAIVPDNATNREATWSLIDAGSTGALLSDDVLSAATGGVAVIEVVITDGLGSGEDFRKTFDITVNEMFVPVSDVLLDLTEMVEGDEIVLDATVLPEDASDQAIVWSLADIGTTEAVLEDGTLKVAAAGTLRLTATIENGFAEGEQFSKDFDIVVSERFVPVEDITLENVSFVAGETLRLVAAVTPDDATNTAVTWSIIDAGSTGAALDADELSADAAGTIVVEAGIENGSADGEAFAKRFDITVTEAFVAVTDVTLAEDSVRAGEILELEAVITPEDATNQTVSWSVADDGGTDAVIDGVSFSATRPGDVIVTVTIEGGTLPDIQYRKDLTVTVLPVPVTDIELALTEIDSGEAVTLDAEVLPENATAKDIVWTLIDAGTTGAALDGNSLMTGAGGRVVLKASIEGGQASGEAFEKIFEITVNQSVVLVTDIQLAQAEMLQGETLELSANVLPSDATTTTIVWSLKNAGSTEATLSDNRLTAPGAGTAVVTATIDQGDGIVFAKDFQITVHTVFVAVTDIADIPTELNAGDSIVLSGTVMPENATNKNIFWAMNNPGTTRATLRENTLTTSAGGVITLTATIRNGLEIGEDFVKRVEITVSDEGQTPDTPVFKVNLPPSLNVVVGNQAALSVIMEESNAEEVRYAWYKDDVLIPEATEATLTLEAAALTDAGRYKVVVTNVLNEEEATAESVVSELRVTAAPLTVYQVLFGSQQTYRGGNIGLMFGTSIPFEEFNSVSINGVIVPPAEYDVRRGSTIVELSAHYLSLLRNGTYNMRINAVNGYAEVTFFVMSAVQPTQPTQPTVPSQTVQPTFSQPATVVPPQGTTTPLPTTVITGVGPTQTIPGSPQTGERSSLVYILSGAGLLLLAAVFIVIAVRRRRADEDEFGEEYPPDEDEFSDELPPDEDTDSK